MNLNRAYEICEKKTYIHKDKMKSEIYELGGCTDGEYYNIPKGCSVKVMWNWMSSFVTGLGLLAFENNHDMDFIRWANSFYAEYEDKVFRTPLETMHDLGFLYVPYSVYMWKLTGAHEHKRTALKAADELAKRFDVRGRYIEAWSYMSDVDKSGYMISDTMMNLPLLFWAWKESGHTHYLDVAVEHTKTAIKYLIRPDYSACHAHRFNDKTGESLGEFNSCGNSLGSHWARGNAWLIYGLAIAASYTGNKEFLENAEKVSEKFISCLTEDDGIPVWDFRLPADQPAMSCGKNEVTTWDFADPKNKVYNRDTSAAAIAACGFQLIHAQNSNKMLDDEAERILKVLSEKYLNQNETQSAILRCSNGNMTNTTYGDYFFMEALSTRLFGLKSCWIQ